MYNVSLGELFNNYVASLCSKRAEHNSKTGCTIMQNVFFCAPSKAAKYLVPSNTLMPGRLTSEWDGIESV